MAVPERLPATLRAPLWLAHHHAGELDRCVRLGRLAVCRRCLVLYPAVIAWSALLVTIAPSPATLALMAWTLPIPLLIDWVAEHLGITGPSAVRLVAVTSVAAPGLAAVLALHAAEHFSPAAVAPVLLYGSIALGTALLGARRRRSSPWHSCHDADEARRVARLHALLAEVDRQESRSADPSSPPPGRGQQSSVAGGSVARS